jgi:hypothetical protein
MKVLDCKGLRKESRLPMGSELQVYDEALIG